MNKALSIVLPLLVLLVLAAGCSKTPTDRAADAREKLSYGELSEARDILDLAAAADTTGAVERYGRGLIREYNGLDWEAMITYLEGAPMGDGFIPSIEGFMRLALKVDYLGNGLQMARVMMDKFPDNPRGYLYAGRFFTRYHMHDSVDVYFNKAEEKGIAPDELTLARAEHAFITGNDETITEAMGELSRRSFSDGPACSFITDLYRGIHFGDSAIVYARRAIGDDGANIDYRLQLTQVLFDERRIYEAKQEIDRLFELAEDCNRVDLLGAYILADLGNAERALELISKYLNDNRESPIAAKKQGDYLAHARNYNGAIIQYQLAYTLAGNLRYPDDYIQYLFLKLENAMLEYGDIATAYAYFKEALDRFTGIDEEMDFFKAELVLRFPEVADSAHIIVDENLSYNWSNGDWMEKAARYYRRSNQHEMSARTYKRMLELPQAKPEHAIYMIEAYEQLEQYDKIIEAEAGIPLRVRRDIAVMAKLRDVYLAHGDTARAREVAEKLYVRNDEYIPYLNVLAGIYTDAGMTEQAEQLYTKLADTYPDLKAPHYERAKYEFMNGSLDTALSLIEDILDKDSLYSPAIELYGKMLEDKGDIEGALKQYRRVIDLRGITPYSYNRVARELINDKDSLLRAEGLARSAIVYYNNTSPDGYVTLGDVYMAGKKYKLARTQYTKAVKIEPENAELYFLLGRAQYRAGETKEAGTNLKKALELRPDADFAASARALLK